MKTSGLQSDAGTSARFDNENRARLVELERKVRYLTATLAALDQENELNRGRLVLMRESLSWRITSPLRRVRRLISRRAER